MWSLSLLALHFQWLKLKCLFVFTCLVWCITIQSISKIKNTFQTIIFLTFGCNIGTNKKIKMRQYIPLHEYANEACGTKVTRVNKTFIKKGVLYDWFQRQTLPGLLSVELVEVQDNSYIDLSLKKFISSTLLKKTEQTLFPRTAVLHEEVSRTGLMLVPA